MSSREKGGFREMGRKRKRQGLKWEGKGREEDYGKRG